MKKEEHDKIHLIKDIRCYLKIIIQNGAKYPFEIKSSAIDLKERIDYLYEIKCGGECEKNSSGV